MWVWNWWFTVCHPTYNKTLLPRIPHSQASTWDWPKLASAGCWECRTGGSALILWWSLREVLWWTEEVGSLYSRITLCSLSPLLLLTSTKEAINSCLGWKPFKVRITQCGLCPCWATLMSYVHLATITSLPEPLTGPIIGPFRYLRRNGYCLILKLPNLLFTSFVSHLSTIVQCPNLIVTPHPNPPGSFCKFYWCFISGDEHPRILYNSAL